MLLLKYFKVDIILFLYSVERHYHVTNPYHNGVHAADVTQAMSCFIQVKLLCLIKILFQNYVQVKSLK